MKTGGLDVEDKKGVVGLERRGKGASEARIWGGRRGQGRVAHGGGGENRAHVPSFMADVLDDDYDELVLVSDEQDDHLAPVTANANAKKRKRREKEKEKKVSFSAIHLWSPPLLTIHTATKTRRGSRPRRPDHR